MSGENISGEFFIVVDVEASGPNPANYDLLSIGACTVTQPRKTFYAELKPGLFTYTAEAMAVNRLSLERLQERGLEPQAAMQKFADWVKEVLPAGCRPVFTAFNAPFDWMFVNDYFHRYLNSNPFGHKALDIKAYYMGVHGTNWADTSHDVVVRRYFGDRQLTHHALRDALDEADIFEALHAEAG